MASLQERLQYQRIPQLPQPKEKKGIDAIFNANYLVDIPQQLNTWGSKRVFIVASKSLEAKTDVVSKLEKELGSAVVAKKSGVGAHSPYKGTYSFHSSWFEYISNTLISNQM
jgi:hypothetical protein